jgi:putative cell wall-binding protein
VRRFLLLIALVAGTLVPATGASAAPTVSRLAGSDRYATAVAVSQSRFGGPIDTVFVATGAAFPDALAGGPAAARRRAPVLLVERDRIPDATAAELDRLDPAHVVVLGGAASVSDAVMSRLRTYATSDTNRVAGEDRFATAAAVSSATFTASGVPVAYVANGDTFPDALAGGPAAGASGGPVLLTHRDSLPQATIGELQRVKPNAIAVLGGTAAVSSAVEQQLKTLAPNVGRSEGPDRDATSVAVSKNAFAPGVPAVYVATGAAFADALAGGPVAALAPGPILLVQRDCMTQVVNDEIDRLNPAKLIVLGGTSAVGTAVEQRRTCPPPSAGPKTPTVVQPSATPAFDADAPDPDVVRVGTTYYAFTTGTTWGNRIGVLTSSSPNTGWRTLTGKSFGSTALPSIPSWQQPDTQWAPGVFAWNNRWVMFYAAQSKANGHWCLSVATATGPAGPYSDASTGPIVCQLDLGGSIDPQPFVDVDGRPWLHWKNNDGSSPAVSSVWAAPLGPDGTTLAGPAQLVMSKDSVNHPWQNTVDNPQMAVVDGVHYLFFSGGDFESDRYAVGYAVCDGPAGPCRQPSAGPILSSYGTVAGPAGGTVFDDGAGNWWLSYPAWTAGCTSYACGGARRFYLAALSFR